MRIVPIAVWIHVLSVLATPTTILMGYTDYFLFDVSLQEFVLAHTREEGAVAGIDWWWDGCWVAPDKPFGFEYRKHIDDNFEKDLHAQCAKKKDGLRREICERTASGYYHGVRIFGGARFCDREATISILFPSES
ncbi:hypothetical protein HBI69_049000 [Parastagonospora nodorum]|nr:hypothetical protein HBI69_049000 [Parastagonospora nodorum]